MNIVTQGEAYRAFEHAAWERAAASYCDTFAAATWPFAGPLLDAVTCERGALLLDVACGPGLVCAIAAERGATATGVDFSAAMIAEARQRNPQLAFEHGDAESLPFGDETFDRVVCNFGVHHFAYPQRAVAQIHRVLKRGGRFAFTAWASDEHVPQQLLVNTIRAHGAGARSLPSPPHGDLNNIAACLQLLRETGFHASLIHAAKVRSVLKVASMAELITMMQKGTARSSALLQSQPAETMAAIHAGIEAAAAQYKRGRFYELPAVAVLATAGKA